MYIVEDIVESWEVGLKKVRKVLWEIMWEGSLKVDFLVLSRKIDVKKASVENQVEDISSELMGIELPYHRLC